MVELLKNFLGSSCMVIASFFIWGVLLQKSFSFKNYKNYAIVIIHIIAIIINYFYCTDIIKMIILIIILTSLFHHIFHERIGKSIVFALEVQLLSILSELIYLSAMTFFTDFNVDKLVQTTFGTLLTNFVVSSLMVGLIHIPFIKKICLVFIENAEKLSEKQLIIIIIGLMGVINMLLFGVYYKTNAFILIFINSSFIFFAGYIVFKILKEKSINQQYKAENDALINNLHEYEKMVDQHRVINHENKNQLGIIKTMIETKDETVLAYIDDLVENDSTPDETLLSRTSRIPAGGLQGIIYQKLLTMKKEQINYTLNISRDIKFLDFKKLDIATMVALCKIVGVFLDNAIEEVKKLEKTYIGIELYVEDDAFCIKVSNNYSRGQDFSRIEELGYTTKTNGHGYGLSLVREIIEKNDRLINERSVTGKYFNQIVKVLDMCEE